MTDPAAEAAAIQQQMRQARDLAVQGHDADTISTILGMRHSRAEAAIAQARNVAPEVQQLVRDQPRPRTEMPPRDPVRREQRKRGTRQKAIKGGAATSQKRRLSNR